MFGVFIHLKFILTKIIYNNFYMVSLQLRSVSGHYRVDMYTRVAHGTHQKMYHQKISQLTKIKGGLEKAFFFKKNAS